MRPLSGSDRRRAWRRMLPFANSAAVLLGKDRRTAGHSNWRRGAPAAKAGGELDRYAGERSSPIRPRTVALTKDVPLYTSAANTQARRSRLPSPVSLSLYSPGTNCEYDTVRAFEKAGAETDVLVVQQPVLRRTLKTTIERMEKAIRNAQIIMLPGGFSGGDEPDGSGKFIATTFRNPENRGGGHGPAQKPRRPDARHLQWLPGAHQAGPCPLRRDPRDERDRADPDLQYPGPPRVPHGVYAHHQSVKSPWFAGCTGRGCVCGAGIPWRGPLCGGRRSAGPVGRTMARSPRSMWTWRATRAATSPGTPTVRFALIEGITSPDGRVLGKMGHSERKGEQPVPQCAGRERSARIFESGVAYFK